MKFGKSGATEGDGKLDTEHSNETLLSKTIPGGLGARNDGDERGSRRDSMFFWTTEASYILDSHFLCRTFDCKSTSPKEEANIRGGCRSNRSLKTSVLSSVAAKMA